MEPQQFEVIENNEAAFLSSIKPDSATQSSLVFHIPMIESSPLGIYIQKKIIQKIKWNEIVYSRVSGLFINRQYYFGEVGKVGNG